MHRKRLGLLVAVHCCQSGSVEAHLCFMLVSVALCRSTAIWAGSADVLSCHAGHVSTTAYHSCYFVQDAQKAVQQGSLGSAAGGLFCRAGAGSFLVLYPIGALHCL